jgi:hypothetical protein
MDKWLVAETVDGLQIVYYDGKSRECICTISVDLGLGAAQILADNLNNCKATPEKPR